MKVCYFLKLWINKCQWILPNCPIFNSIIREICAICGKKNLIWTKEDFLKFEHSWLSKNLEGLLFLKATDWQVLMNFTKLPNFQQHHPWKSVRSVGKKTYLNKRRLFKIQAFAVIKKKYLADFADVADDDNWISKPSRFVVC